MHYTASRRCGDKSGYVTDFAGKAGGPTANKKSLPSRCRAGFFIQFRELSASAAEDDIILQLCKCNVVNRQEVGCIQIDLDAAVQKAAEKKAKLQEAVPTPEERISLMPVEESLGEPPHPGTGELPSNVSGFESFSMDDPRGEDDDPSDALDIDPDAVDPDALFNLPRGGGKDD